VSVKRACRHGICAGCCVSIQLERAPEASCDGCDRSATARGYADAGLGGSAMGVCVLDGRTSVGAQRKSEAGLHSMAGTHQVVLQRQTCSAGKGLRVLSRREAGRLTVLERWLTTGSEAEMRRLASLERALRACKDGGASGGGGPGDGCSSAWGRAQQETDALQWTMSFFLAGSAADGDSWRLLEMQRRAAERLLVGGFERGATLGPIHRNSPV
jgi:hypothetical protein